MSATTGRISHNGRLRSRLFIALCALGATFAVLAPIAQAEYGIVPGSAMVKGHEPYTPKVYDPFGPPPPPGSVLGITIPGGTQGVFYNYQESLLAGLKALPETTVAGGHPDFTTYFAVQDWGLSPDGMTRDIYTDLPAGSVGFPQAVVRCESADLNLTLFGRCPTEAQVGLATTNALIPFFSPINSMVPVPGEQATLGYKVFGFVINLFARVRSESDYGLTIEARDLPTLVPLQEAEVTLWGVPYDPIHNDHRFDTDGSHGGTPLGASVTGTAVRPFTSAPTNCDTGPLKTTIKVRSWGHPEKWIADESFASEQTGCDQIEFDPEVRATPTTGVADSPTGLNIDVHVPQDIECDIGPPLDCPPSVSHLKDTRIALPQGMTLNPSAANGLEGCSPAEIGLTTPLGSRPIQFTDEPANCPDGSKIGTAEVETPLLEAPMPGAVYLAEPYDNPFGTLLAIYIGVDDPRSGIVSKFVGRVDADPVTGQLSTTVIEQPQLPIEHTRLNFKQGPHAILRTPPACGEYTTASQLVPYSAPDSSFEFADKFSIDSSPQGACSPLNAPDFDAGTVSPIAGRYSPLVVRVSRPDGSQEFRSLTLSPPAGLIARLAGIPYCPDSALTAAKEKDGKAERASASCPAASDIGNVVVGAGAGPSPYYTEGNAYLAGPYKGAPLSIAVITPAVAGPFDLGTVVVRAALYIDPVTTKISAVSDEIPPILHGIPLDVRSIAVQLDRGDFTKNPTSCDPTSVDGTMVSVLNISANLTERFQLGECRRLGFQPKIRLRLDGRKFTRTSHPRLTAVVLPREGDANIANASVLMPNSLLLDQGHIGSVCTRVQFAADACPSGSIYGSAVATTPLLDQPLSGNVYLRSSDNPLPDLVADLNGQVSVELSGRTDTVKGALRNTFDLVPDAPVSRFELNLLGGKKSLLQANTNLCRKAQKATVTMTGHNGRRQVVKQKIEIHRCKRKRGGKR